MARIAVATPEQVPDYLADLRIIGQGDARRIRGTIYRALCRAARYVRPCPSAEVLADLCGVESASTTVYHMRALERERLIACESFQRGRVVTIIATGHRTRPVVGAKANPHWRYVRDGEPVDSHYARTARGARG